MGSSWALVLTSGCLIPRSQVRQTPLFLHSSLSVFFSSLVPWRGSGRILGFLHLLSKFDLEHKPKCFSSDCQEVAAGIKEDIKESKQMKKQFYIHIYGYIYFICTLFYIYISPSDWGIADTRRASGNCNEMYWQAWKPGSCHQVFVSGTRTHGVNCAASIQHEAVSISKMLPVHWGETKLQDHSSEPAAPQLLIPWQLCPRNLISVSQFPLSVWR